MITIDDTTLETWFERDRAHVALYEKPSEDNEHLGRLVIDWWDECVTEMVEDGFLDPRNYHQSAYDYAKKMDLFSKEAE